ncbi:MAG TPA: MtnX-like HAD-IB family phosphatase, partial [Nitrospiria bacterium]|nr:MtnX-like HAD-IB family phosphatase [Nitrospiria bacterium]
MKGQVRPPSFLFLDYDGTITEKDTILSIMEAFAPAEWVSLRDSVLSGEISVRKGVGAMFALLPSRLKGRIVRFAKKETRIRNGFSDFLKYCRRMKIDYKVISGGLDFYLYPLLEDYLPREKVFCNRANFSGDTIGIDWGFPCDPYCHLDCGFCKASLVRQYDPAL